MISRDLEAVESAASKLDGALRIVQELQQKKQLAFDSRSGSQKQTIEGQQEQDELSTLEKAARYIKEAGNILNELI